MIFLYRPLGGALGDPHLTTLDGLSFTFNGHGEFILLKASDMEVQGRFAPLMKDGIKGATCISSIVGKQTDSDKVEIRLNTAKNDAGLLYFIIACFMYQLCTTVRAFPTTQPSSCRMDPRSLN